MRKIHPRAPTFNGRDTPLPLLALIERNRWAEAPLAARMIRRRCGIQSASLATALAQLAGFRQVATDD
jgi:hypothetical protein